MSAFTVRRPDLFPDGTSVAAYVASTAGPGGVVPSSGAPAGSVVETQVAAAGALVFSSLAARTSYVLYAGGPDRYLRLNTSAGGSVYPELSGDPADDTKAISAGTGTALSVISPGQVTTGTILQSSSGGDPVAMITRQGTPITSKHASSWDYGTDNGSGNIFHGSDFVTNTGSRATVARFFGAEGKHVFAFNGVSYANDGAGTGVAIGGEVDFGVTDPLGGSAYGIVFKSLGGNVGGVISDGAFIQMQAAASSAMPVGIKFHVSGGNQPISTSLVEAETTTVYGLNFQTAAFTTAAAWLPVNSGSTTASFGAVIQSRGGYSNAGAGIRFQAVDASSKMAKGIDFHASGSNQPVSGDLISADTTSPYGINFTTAFFTTAAAWLPVNSGSTSASYGAVIEARGGFANTGAAIRIAAVDVSSSVRYGIDFNTNVGQPVSNTLIRGLGVTATKGIDFSTATLTTGIDLGPNNLLAGAATFSSPVTVAEPTGSGHATTKSYVDERRTASKLNPTNAFGETLDRRVITGSSISAFASGTIQMNAAYLVKGEVVANLTYLAGTAATGSVTHRWVGLFDSSRNKIRVSADDTTAWNAGTVKAFALTSSYTVPTSGLYYYGLVETVSSGACTACRGQASSSNATGIAPIIAGTADTGMTDPTSCPSTTAAITANNQIPYAYAT